MIKLKTMPKDTAVELLRFIAEHERFQSVENLEGSDLTTEETRATLRELADQLSREVAAEEKATYDVKGSKTLSKDAKKIISCLSPSEEQNLLSVFGLIDKPLKTFTRSGYRSGPRPTAKK